MKMLALVFAFTAAVSAQVRDGGGAPSVGTATLAGIVQTDDAPPQPIRRAVVTLTGAAIRGERQFVTDETGRWLFNGLPAGRYTLTAEKPAYVKTFFGSRKAGQPPGTPVVVIADQQKTDIAITLLRGAVITGVVRGVRGEPLGSSQVTAYTPVVTNGERKLVSVRSPFPQATTDDQGRYRLYGLPPGEYTVGASGGGGSLIEITGEEVQAALRELQAGPAAAGSPPPAPVRQVQVAVGVGYFPGVDDPNDARTFMLAAGEERSGVDLVGHIVKTSRVEGISLGPTGQPMPNVWIALTRGADRSCAFSPGGVRPNAEGKVTLPPLGSGPWSLIGRGAEGATSPTGGPTVMPYWAEVDFVVTGGVDLTGVTLQFAPGMTLTGRVIFRGTQPGDPTKLRISLQRTTSGGCGEPAPLPTVTPQADGTFTLPNVPPGKYRVTAVTSGTPWTMRSAVVGGRDSLDTPLEITTANLQGLEVTFTDQPAEITGLVTDSLGRPAPEYSVVAFSTDRNVWATSPRRLSGAIKIGTDGRYRIAGLPPGNYYVAVLTDIDARQATDPTVLESLIPASLTITLGEGEKKTQDLRLGTR